MAFFTSAVGVLQTLVIALEAGSRCQTKIESLSESLRELEVLREEVLQMQSVDFKKYADIIVNLQMKNDFYWLIKHFDDQTLDHIRSHFDKDNGMAFMNAFMQLQDEAIRLQNADVPVDSDEGQNFAKAYWNMITDFTGGDISMFPRLDVEGQISLHEQIRQLKATGKTIILADCRTAGRNNREAL